VALGVFLSEKSRADLERGMVQFRRVCTRHLPGRLGDKRQVLQAAIDNLEAGGDTACSNAVSEALYTAAKRG